MGVFLSNSTRRGADLTLGLLVPHSAHKRSEKAEGRIFPIMVKAASLKRGGKLSGVPGVFLVMHGSRIPWYSRPMDATSALRQGSRVAFVLFASAASLLAFGCDEPAAQAQPKGAVLPKSAPAAPALPAKADQPQKLVGKPSYQEDAFHLSLEAPESVSVGKEAVFKVLLTAQGGYKVNDEYPLKFQFTETDQVRPAKATVRKEDATIEKKRAQLPLSVTIQSSGKHKVSGKLSFSVCTDERCLIEKRDLSIEVDAS